MVTVKSSWDYFIRLFWIFLLGSIFGCIVETIYGFFKNDCHFVIRQGLLYGPFVQIYGLGAVAYYILISKTQDPRQVFILSFLMGGALEFICSLLQEKIFNSVSWNYSGTFLNVQGRTNFQYCIYWGLIGLVFLEVFWKYVPNLHYITDSPKWRLITYILMIFILLDVLISSIALIRQDQRRQNITARNHFEAMIDKAYPDDYLNKIYNNRITVE